MRILPCPDAATLLAAADLAHDPAKWEPLRPEKIMRNQILPERYRFNVKRQRSKALSDPRGSDNASLILATAHVLFPRSGIHFVGTPPPRSSLCACSFRRSGIHFVGTCAAPSCLCACSFRRSGIHFVGTCASAPD